MNGGSISRKPISGVQASPAAAPPHFVSATPPSTSMPPPSTYPALQQVAPVYASAQPIMIPNYAYGPTQAPIQNVGVPQYQSPVMSTPVSSQQAMPVQAPPTQVAPMQTVPMQSVPMQAASTQSTPTTGMPPSAQPYYTFPIMNAQPPNAMSPVLATNMPNQPNGLSQLASPTSPMSATGPGWLTRRDTTNSIISSPSDYSQAASATSSFVPGTPATTVSIPETPIQPAAVAGPSIGTCTSCKQAIAQNVSIFTCLVCSTASITTHICVWCYTTGAAASSHAHDISYLATDSDLHAPDATGLIPANVWTIRKNASGRLWYTHNQTSFRTHIRPLTAAGEDPAAMGSLPPDWQEFKTHDGKLYYFQASTNTSIWERPKNTLPSGWAMIKTPDGVPFYVHEALQLSTWARPGEQPKPLPVNPPAGTATTPPGTAVTTTGGKPGKKGKTAMNVATAAAVANNVAKLSAASDLSPSGILTATVAAAKLTGIGVKLAGKKMGRLGKMKHLNTATNVLGVAARLTGDGDDDDDDDGAEVDEVDETTETEVTYETTDTVVVVDETAGDGDGMGTGVLEQPPYQSPYTMPSDPTFPAQQPTYYPQTQPIYLCDPPMAAPAPVIMDQPLVPFPVQPPVVVNNINVNVEETSSNDINVQNTAYTDTTVYPPINPPPVQQGATIIDLSWAVPPAIYRPPDAAAGFGPEVPPPEPLPPAGVAIPPEIGPTADSLLPTQQTDGTPIDTGFSDTAEGEALPFVFNPVLAAPLAVPPPAGEDGVVFDPVYV